MESTRSDCARKTVAVVGNMPSKFILFWTRSPARTRRGMMAVLPKKTARKKRKDRTLAQIAERAGNAPVAGRRAASGGGLRYQQRSPEQCDRLHHAEGHARRAPAGDPV